MSAAQTYSVIVETENLAMAGFEDLASSLQSIEAQTFPIKSIKEVLLIVGGHVSSEVLKKIQHQFPWVKVHIEKSALDYAKSKMRGAEVATGSTLIFADSDMRYQKTWLENMIKASRPGVIVSGDTRLETISAYALALNCTWMIQILNDDIDQPIPTSSFPLNNFAIVKRDLMQAPIPYQLPLYRNKIPLWEQQIQHAGMKIVRAPGTRGFHAPPGSLIDWWYRMLIYGADFVSQADFSVDGKGKIVEETNRFKRLGKLLLLGPWKVEQLLVNGTKLLLEDWRRAQYVPVALFICFANITVMMIGALLAFIQRDFVFNKINAHEETHVV